MTFIFNVYLTYCENNNNYDKEGERGVNNYQLQK